METKAQRKFGVHVLTYHLPSLFTCGEFFAPDIFKLLGCKGSHRYHLHQKVLCTACLFSCLGFCKLFWFVAVVASLRKGNREISHWPRRTPAPWRPLELFGAARSQASLLFAFCQPWDPYITKLRLLQLASQAQHWNTVSSYNRKNRGSLLGWNKALTETLGPGWSLATVTPSEAAESLRDLVLTHGCSSLLPGQMCRVPCMTKTRLHFWKIKTARQTSAEAHGTQAGLASGRAGSAGAQRSLPNCRVNAF